LRVIRKLETRNPKLEASSKLEYRKSSETAVILQNSVRILSFEIVSNFEFRISGFAFHPCDVAIRIAQPPLPSSDPLAFTCLSKPM
jgi:hypothetical protein